jgi:hypothetical protein
MKVKRQISDGGLMTKHVARNDERVLYPYFLCGNGIVSIKLSVENSDYCPIKGKKKKVKLSL